MDKPQSSYNLNNHYIFLEEEKALSIEVTPSFWEELMTNNLQSENARRVAEGKGWLVSAYQMDESFPTWELHPEGDEILFLVSGLIDVIFEENGKERTISLCAGATCTVPRNMWHRQIVHQPGQMLAITYGRGTQHRPI